MKVTNGHFIFSFAYAKTEFGDSEAQKRKGKY
jgi:hypothetical protein